MTRVFRRRANRFMVHILGYGLVPAATEQDDRPVFESDPPKRVGDHAIIRVEGSRRLVRLLPSASGKSLWLVDTGVLV